MSDAPPGEARSAFGLDPDARTLLVTGGSQGARSINALLRALAQRRPEALRGWQVLHQCGGAADADELRAAYAAAGVHSHVAPFIQQMGQAWRAADLAVGRAGAGTVGEMWANHVPALLLPYPHHRDEHQRANAARIAEAGGCVVETDLVDAEANLAGAGGALESLLKSPADLGRMRSALQELGPADGARRAAEAVLGVLGEA